MSENPFKRPFKLYTENLLYLQHTANLIEHTYKSHVPLIESNSLFPLQDWTPEAGQWSSFPVGETLRTDQENYKHHIGEILSQNYCYLFAQAFEYLESFLKNCMYEMTLSDPNRAATLIQNREKAFSRNNMVGGDRLFRQVRSAGGRSFQSYCKVNRFNIRFKAYWKVISEVRNSIVHSGSRINISERLKGEVQLATYDFLFKLRKINPCEYMVYLDIQTFRHLIPSIGGFGFQIYKSLCQENGFDHNYYNRHQR